MYKKKQDTKPPKPQVISYERVKNYMLWLIGKYGDYSSKTLMQKANLLFKDDTQYNERALEYLIEHEIVDDLRYATRLTSSYSEQNIGLNKIKEKLYAKGLSTNIINECINGLDNTEEDYFEKAFILKVRKFGEQPIDDLKLKQKALRHLIAKGFSYSVANKVIKYVPDE